MKIAVVWPAPTPPIFGGLENLLFNLVASINEYTKHKAELVEVPTKEHTFWDLVESYKKFYDLDLSNFDMIITTKYPAWMIRHKNHVLWMAHKLRGLYDTYPPTEPLGVDKKILECCKLAREILQVTQSDPTDSNITRLFNLLSRLKKESKLHKEWADLFKLPGPFIRKIIHFMDDVALSHKKIRSFNTISNTVKLRGYLPTGVKAKTIYVPPTSLTNKSEEYDYLLTVNRLDAPKRVDLSIKAMCYVPKEIKLKVVGDGPLYDELVKMAKNDRRIEFTGFVEQDELEDLYSNALAILYTPYDEDLGLVPLEAFAHKKPVITLTDSGGPTELIKDGVNGFVVKPDPQSIAEKINFLIANKAEARRMGEAGYDLAKKINWEDTTLELLGEKREKTKMVVFSTYSSYPALHGGQVRLYNLYKNLAKYFDITILSLVEMNKPSYSKILENGLTQICISENRVQAEQKFKVERETGIPLHDICLIDSFALSEEFMKMAREHIDEASILVFSHPYLFNLSKLADEDKIKIYDSHNVEYLLKKNFLKNSKSGTALVKKVFDIEQKTCLKSDLIFSVSKEDKEQFIKLYGVPQEKIIVIPNGVDLKNIKFITMREKIKQKKKYGLGNHKVVVFVGSWHPPNLEALEFIIALSHKLPEVYFFIIGSVADYYLQTHPQSKIPKNVLLFTTVSDEEKEELYKLSDVAINPMLSGSGSNLKMLEFMAVGIPIVSTAIGARGLNLKNGNEVLISNIKLFEKNLVKLLEDSKLQEKLRHNAREKACYFDWGEIAKQARNSIINRVKT
ncbi:MAG: glycosyltransferase family 4 protein [Candidatus Micrarchaeia archaeon]